jgi:hypothetical protein
LFLGLTTGGTGAQVVLSSQLVGTRLFLGLTPGGSGDQVVPGVHNWWQWGPGCSRGSQLVGTRLFLELTTGGSGTRLSIVPGAHNWWGPGCSWSSQLVAVGTRLFLVLTTGGPGCSWGSQLVGTRLFLGLTQQLIICGDQGFPGAHSVPKCAWDGAGYMFWWLPWFVYLPHARTCNVHRACAHACLCLEARSVTAAQSQRCSPRGAVPKCSPEERRRSEEARTGTSCSVPQSWRSCASYQRRVHVSVDWQRLEACDAGNQVPLDEALRHVIEGIGTQFDAHGPRGKRPRPWS